MGVSDPPLPLGVPAESQKTCLVMKSNADSQCSPSLGLIPAPSKQPRSSEPRGPASQSSSQWVSRTVCTPDGCGRLAGCVPVIDACPAWRRPRVPHPEPLSVHTHRHVFTRAHTHRHMLTQRHLLTQAQAQLNDWRLQKASYAGSIYRLGCIKH